jgi:hypothetical protein
MGGPTLLQIRNAAKDRADMSGSTTSDQLIPDSTWNQYINASLGEYHDLVVRNDVRFYLTSSIFTLAPGQNTYPLPVNFMVANGFERSYDGSGTPGTWYDVPKFPWRERNWGNNSYISLLMLPWVRYNIYGTNIMITPQISAAGLYQLWYYPQPPVLVADTDSMFSLDAPGYGTMGGGDDRSWWEYVVVDVAIKALQKEESDVSVLMAQKQGLMARIELMGSDRDFAEPEQIGRRGPSNGGYGGPGNIMGGGFGW